MDRENIIEGFSPSPAQTVWHQWPIRIWRHMGLEYGDEWWFMVFFTHQSYGNH